MSQVGIYWAGFNFLNPFQSRSEARTKQSSSKESQRAQLSLKRERRRKRINRRRLWRIKVKESMLLVTAKRFPEISGNQLRESERDANPWKKCNALTKRHESDGHWFQSHFLAKYPLNHTRTNILLWMQWVKVWVVCSINRIACVFGRFTTKMNESLQKCGRIFIGRSYLSKFRAFSWL